MRFRLIPTRSKLGKARFIKADSVVQALTAGEALAEDIRGRVLVCVAPEGGLVREIETVGEIPEKKRGR